MITFKDLIFLRHGLFWTIYRMVDQLHYVFYKDIASELAREFFLFVFTSNCLILLLLIIFFYITNKPNLTPVNASNSDKKFHHSSGLPT